MLVNILQHVPGKVAIASARAQQQLQQVTLNVGHLNLIYNFRKC